MSPIDVAIIIAYLLGTMLIGFLARGKDRSADDFFTASGGMRGLFNQVLIGLSIASALFSGISFIAYPSVVFSSGIMLLAGVVFVCMPASFLILRYWFLPRFLSLGYKHPYDVLEARFGRPTRTLAASMFVLMRIGWMAAMVFAPTAAIMTMGKLDGRWFWPLVLAQGLTSTVFTVFAGVRGVVVTDAIQMIVIALGIAATICFALGSVPVPLDVAMSDLWTSGRLKVWEPSLDPTIGFTFWTIAIGATIANLGNYIPDQMCLQRYLATGSVREASRSFLVNVLGVYIVLILLAGIGLSLFVYYSHVSDPTLPMKNGVVDADGVFPHFVATRLPTGFAGLLMAAIMAASSMTPGINTVAGVLTLDFHARARPDMPGEQKLRWARRYALLVGLSSTLIAGLLRNTAGLSNLIQVILGVFAGPLLACMVLAMTSWRISGAAMTIGLLLGSAAGIAATRTSVAALWVAPIAVTVTAATALFLSTVTRRHPAPAAALRA